MGQPRHRERKPEHTHDWTTDFLHPRESAFIRDPFNNHSHGLVDPKRSCRVRGLPTPSSPSSPSSPRPIAKDSDRKALPRLCDRLRALRGLGGGKSSTPPRSIGLRDRGRTIKTRRRRARGENAENISTPIARTTRTPLPGPPHPTRQSKRLQAGRAHFPLRCSAAALRLCVSAVSLCATDRTQAEGGAGPPAADGFGGRA